MATATDDNFKKLQEKFEFILQQGVDSDNNSTKHSVIWAKDTALNRVIGPGRYGKYENWAVHIDRSESKILTCMQYDVKADVNELSAPLISVRGACLFNKEIIVKLLLEYGVDVNAISDGFTPIHQALRCREKEIFEILLQKGADINIGGANSLLRSAISRRMESLVKYLLENGADLNARECLDGKTPLHDAAYQNPEILRVLLDAGADVNATFSEGYTALDVAMAGIIMLRVPSRENLKVLYKHVVSLKVAGLYVNERNIRIMGNPIDELKGETWYYTFIPKLNSHELECRQELERIKSELGTNLSLKYILTTDKPRYLRNKTLAQQLESINYKDFPIYGNMLKRKHEIDKKKLSLLDGTSESSSDASGKRQKNKATSYNWRFVGKDCYLSHSDSRNLKFDAGLN